MCDTVVALGSATADGAVIFGKNSDREPNEAHHLLLVPRARHEPGSTVKCTYIEIPQVEETYAVLLSKPFWMWGAEMGANEHGVVIGNEAVFTKVPYEKTGLLGMDLIRLALERSRTAREALDVITTLLEAHGQGGNCGFARDFYYHNSFIIADPTDAWVLETAGRQWAAEQVRDIRTISNGLTIGSEGDLASDDLVNYAVDRGWCKGRDDFHFARCYSDFVYTTFGRSHARQCRTTDVLRARKGAITVESVIAALRDHGPASPDAGPDWTPARGIGGRQICQHAGWGPIRGDQATGSMVSHLTPDAQTHFLTGTSAPCTSIFKPVWIDAGLPDIGPEPTGTYDEATLFWRHEALHRATLRDYATRIRLYADERDELERGFIEGALSCASAPQEERAAFSARCFEQADQAEADWWKRVQAAAGPARMGPLYAAAWRKFNTEAKMPELP
ncbi:MAG: peptidase U34 [Chloroflexi bacterium]|nr:peptidase U34 [Chloroflexota bacterium]